MGAEEHPRTQLDEEDAAPGPESEDDRFDNIEFEMYDAGWPSDNDMNSIDERINCIEEEDLHDLSENEVVYGNPSESLEEEMEMIPLFEFSSIIPDMVPKANMAMRVSPDQVDRPNGPIMAMISESDGTVPQQGHVKLRVQKESCDRPVPTDKRCLVTMLQVNGLDAVMLWDSRSTSTAMSPAFADISKALVSRLCNPVVLQLGTVGSRAGINFGTTSTITSRGYSGPEYFDVVNIDKYDIIMGTPFMHRNSVVLDFEWKCVIVNGKQIPGKVLDGEEADKITRRHHMRRPNEPKK